jgi:hypothetical protein
MNMARSILEGIEYAVPNAKDLNFPNYIIHGEKDSVTNHKDSILFHRGSSQYIKNTINQKLRNFN